MNDDDPEAQDPGYNPGDLLRRVHYALAPTLYVDEDSDVSELLWQQVLEARAIRAWLVVVTVILLVVSAGAVVIVAA